MSKQYSFNRTAVYKAGPAQRFSLSLPDETCELVDKLTHVHKEARSNIVRRILELGLVKLQELDGSFPQHLTNEQYSKIGQSLNLKLS